MSELLAGVIEDEDLVYEEEVSRNPFSVKSWVRYIDFKQSSNVEKSIREFAIDLIYERALRVHPGSYKLWHAYLMRRTSRIRNARPRSPAVLAVCSLYERALLTMHKMPLIWLAYLQLLMSPVCCFITRTRQAFDRALQALPIAQHELIWPVYLQFAKNGHIPPRTFLGIWKRYLMFEPTALEEYVDLLIEQGVYDEAARRLTEMLQGLSGSPSNRTPAGRTHGQVWLQLAGLLCKHPREVGSSFNTDAIIRAGIERQQAAREARERERLEKQDKQSAFAPITEDGGDKSDEGGTTVGDLWVMLAEYEIRLGYLERARDVFEEALNATTTVADFAVVWDAYSQFEDQVIAQSVAMVESDDGLTPQEKAEERSLLEMRMERYEYLIKRHPLLVNSVFLRQNPHNVNQWFKRIRILEKQREEDGSSDYSAIVNTYTEALKTIDPQKAVGSPHLLWAAFARFYDEADYYDQACTIFEKGLTQPFRRVDDMASLWCEYVEMELRHGHTERARDLARRAVSKPSDPNILRKGTNGQRWGYTSIKLWSLHCDMEECYGTFDTTIAAYNEALALKVATPQMVLNFAALLEEKGYYEESYKAYEKGVTLFSFPYSKPIWITFLTRFVQRFRGRKLERTRDLFEQVLSQAPPQDAKVFYVMYASLEEEYGLSRHAMAVYDRAIKGVADDDKYAMYLLYIARAGEFFGVMKTRDIYEHAMQDTALPLPHLKALTLRFASLERKLGEYDRARAIYVHGAQFCNPDTDTQLWNVWREFEVQHGNDDTFRDMLRVRRSVQSVFMSQINVQGILDAASASVANASSSAAVAPSSSNEATTGSHSRKLAFTPATETASKREGTAMELLEQQVLDEEGNSKSNGAAGAQIEGSSNNPEALDLDL